MGANESEPIGPHVLVYHTEAGLHMDIAGMSPQEIIFVAEMLRRHAGRMLDYQEDKAAQSKPRLVLPQ